MPEIILVIVIIYILVLPFAWKYERKQISKVIQDTIDEVNKTIEEIKRHR